MKTRMAILILSLATVVSTLAAAQESEMVIGGGYMKDKSDLNEYIYGKLGIYWSIGDDSAFGLLANMYVNKLTMVPYFLDSMSLRIGWLMLNLGVSSMLMENTEEITFDPHSFSPVLGLGASIPVLSGEGMSLRLEGVMDIYWVKHIKNSDGSLTYGMDGVRWMDFSNLDALTKLSVGLVIGYGI